MATITESVAPVQSYLAPHADDVVDSAPTARWTVEERAWTEVAPELSDDVTAFVATPLVVCAFVG